MSQTKVHFASGTAETQHFPILGVVTIYMVKTHACNWASIRKTQGTGREKEVRRISHSCRSCTTSFVYGAKSVQPGKPIKCSME